MTSKIVKGIPITQLQKSTKIITNEENVLKFLRSNKTEAFSAELLQQNGFSSNIRKVIQQLIEKDKIIQSSYQQWSSLL